MVYTTESSVYDLTGFSSTIIQNITGKSSAEVTTLISGFITKAEARIKEDIEYPIRISRERHLGDGSKNRFDLGPEDDPYGTEGDYDPLNCVLEIYSVRFGKDRKRKPYPEDCDLGTESISGWAYSNASVAVNTSNDVNGTNAIACTFSSSGYVQYPDGNTVGYLDKIIDQYSDLFFYIKCSDISKNITIRIYDKDGNYAYEEISLRQNNVGQYIWLDLDTFSDKLNWDITEIQYIRFYVDGACTVYIDNMCFTDSWAYSVPSGILHVSVADNISSESPPSENYPFYVDYSYDPFLSSVPTTIAEAAGWLTGIYIIDHLRGVRYLANSFEIFGDTLELDTDQSREGLLGVRTKMLNNYWACLKNWGYGSYGVI